MLSVVTNKCYVNWIAVHLFFFSIIYVLSRELFTLGITWNKMNKINNKIGIFILVKIIPCIEINYWNKISVPTLN